MRKRIVALTFSILLLSPGWSWAAENDPHGSGHGSGSGEKHEQTSTDSNMSPDEHQKMQPTDKHEPDMESHNPATEGNHKSGGNDHGSGDSEGGGHGDGKEVRETPPNFKVLGAFAAVNAGFILAGIWNKWIRRRGA
ncbi:hypothetical protein [Effusibacillus lacus]|uniref:Uncharacterized protein n=1 Tax=Effusibacillus lacus TaxID=1348429 RepID=A0A292YNV4_9BACL|nr:hypothetical protein [Effusibacillus lacus]TCS74959.1 hypothetical protein EDD64_11083 [Effusibacillus lacus]GAX91628.1 hypothetical protein EFBL_3318 [Effusibacillus lacus]